MRKKSVEWRKYVVYKPKVRHASVAKRSAFVSRLKRKHWRLRGELKIRLKRRESSFKSRRNRMS